MPRIRIGNQTAFSARSLTDPFEFALSHGFSAFEWFPDKKPDGGGWALSDIPDSLRQHIRQAGQHMALSVHAPWHANPLDPLAQDVFNQTIQFALDIGARLVNVHLFLEQGIEGYVKALWPVVEATRNCGLLLAIENTLFTRPDEFNALFRLLRRTGGASHVGMCLDIGHANLCAATRSDYVGFLKRLDQQVPIIHLHAHENWGDADSHLALFTGPSAASSVGLEAVFAELARRGFNGAVIMEQWPEPADLLVQAHNRLGDIIEVHWPQDEEERHKAREILPRAIEQVEQIEHAGDFLAALVRADASAQSWREKLQALRDLLSSGQWPLDEQGMAAVAVYLRLLSSGEISTVEDGRHFRPHHHARAAEAIEYMLEGAKFQGHDFLLRRIAPWLPSYADEFLRPEPLTRIRAIAHRNDIPRELKLEIKHSLQNKLHRCAGPEDLVKAEEVLGRITAQGAAYSQEFVEEFIIFVEELREFFNAHGLEQRLEHMLPGLSDDMAKKVIRFLAHKAQIEDNMSGLLEAMESLTEIRQGFAALLAEAGGARAQGLRLADIGLEDYAFVLLSRIINDTKVHDAVAIDALLLALENMRLSGIMPLECMISISEITAFKHDAMKLYAALERSRRVSARQADYASGLFAPVVKALGETLCVSDIAKAQFVEGEVRGTLGFQLSKLATLLLVALRDKLNLPAWDAIVPGQVRGRLVRAALLEGWQSGGEPVIVMLARAYGDEEIPLDIKGLLVSHDIPHLSHLGVRARQHHVPMASAAEPGLMDSFAKFMDAEVELQVSATGVSMQNAQVHFSHVSGHEVKRIEINSVVAETVRMLRIDEITTEDCGAKAYGIRRLAGIAYDQFKVPGTVAIPFSSMHDVPELVLKAIKDSFPVGASLMVRSSSNCEDLEGAAGAGLYESVPNVQPDGLSSAISRVLASLHSTRAVLSRKRLGVDNAQAHMAVIVQEMLSPQYSFISHTVNPLTHDPAEIMIELACGLGEALAGASLAGTPYRAVYKPDEGAVRMVCFASFARAIVVAPDGGTVLKPVDYSKEPMTFDDTMRTELIARIGRACAQVHRSFGAAQDIEGAVVDGAIYIVQARPQQGLW